MTATSGSPPVECLVIRGLRLKQINYTIINLVNDTTKHYVRPIQLLLYWYRKIMNDFASYHSYLSSVVRFSSWCSNNFLHLNVSKTKEMCINFRRNRTVINGELSSTVNLWNRLIHSNTSVLY